MKRIHFESIDSTNTYLKNNYNDLDSYTFVSSDYQTHGRGRSARKWDSEGKDLLFSLLIKDSYLYTKTNVISILSAYSILQILKEYGVNNVYLKWPNDVYVNDKKICGILLESVSKQSIECLIIGVGLNVNEESFNKDYYATSLKLQLHKDIDIEELKNRIYQRFVENINRLIDDYDYYDEIIKYDYLRNKEVNALINNEKKLVRVKKINRDYSLCVESNNEEYNLYSGEISFNLNVKEDI